MLREPKTWIVMADGGRAKIVAPRKDAPGFALVTEIDSPDLHHRTHDLVSDRPGRVQESAYSGHHAIAPHTDPHEAEKMDFMRRLAHHLNQRNAAGEFDELVVFAPPRCLHALRAALDGGTAVKVTHEAGEDLTKLPFAELPQHLERLGWRKAKR